MARAPIGMTRGRRLLLAVLQLTTAREVGARCRVHPQSVRDWANGKHRPPWGAREALQREFRIPALSWLIGVSPGTYTRTR